MLHHCGLLARCGVPVKRIMIHPYGYTLWLTTSHAEYERKTKALRGYGSGRDSDSACGLCGQAGRNFIVGVFSEGVDTLVHELMHVVLHLCDDLSIKLIEDQEPMCYLMGKLVTDSLKAYPEILYQQ